MNKVCCFGEVLLRISPEVNRRWIHNAQMSVYIGGAELNVATALANWNVPVKYCSALPPNYIGEDVAAEISAKNIDTSALLFTGNRIGTYYLPQGTDLKNAVVTYDRAHSSFAELTPGTIDWDKTLADCSWFHFSSINPAVSERAALVCLEGVKAAADRGLTISVDLNMRKKLWQYGRQPVQVMPQLLPYCHIVMGNIWAAEELLGIGSPVKNSDGLSDRELTDACMESITTLQQHYPQAHTVAYTLRLTDHYFSVLKQQNEVSVSKTFALQNLADKVGSGDCFMAGLIYGIYNGQQADKIVNFATSAAVGKMKEIGDCTNQTIAIVKNNMGN